MITKFVALTTPLLLLIAVGYPVTSMKYSLEEKDVFEMEVLKKERALSKKSYLQFLNNKTMHCGIYFLPAGSKDGQQPHAEDEVYYVESGAGKFHVEGRDMDVRPGMILFVAANDTHYFHSITEDLTLLVFFSKAKP